MRKKVNKIWQGFCSVRDYEVKDCFEKGEDLIITHEGEIMTVKNKDLKNPVQLNPKEIQSKMGTKSYHLFDFKWRPDSERLPVDKVSEAPKTPAIPTELKLL